MLESVDWRAEERQKAGSDVRQKIRNPDAKAPLLWKKIWRGGIDAKTSPEGEEAEDTTTGEQEAAAEGNTADDTPLTLLQVNCRSICNKILEFWNLIDIYDSDVVIGTESWLINDIKNAEIFRGDYMVFRRDRCSRGGGVFICVKNYIDCRELWADEESEIIAIEIKGKNPKSMWEIIGVYRAPNEDMRAIERLVAWTGAGRNGTKRSIIGGDKLTKRRLEGKCRAK